MEANVTVPLGSSAYIIHAGVGLLDAVGEGCAGLGLGPLCGLVSDTHVSPLYAERVSAALAKAGFRCKAFTVAAGESSKSLACLGDLYSRVSAAGLDRTSWVMALGGGVVGDLAGFLAATYLRGIPLVQVPTTLLAMVDSSVGGKTGINLPEGKNLVGAFHQPRGVWADLSTLSSLPDREYVAGLAEVVKYGAIMDASFISFLEEHADAMRDRKVDVLTRVVARCCAHKAAVVEEDERERGRRALLNFGHTLGHAIERWGGYEGLLHGEAVSMGMVYAARLSARMGTLCAGDASRLVALLERFGLPVRKPGADWEELEEAMTRDKKARSGTPRFVLLDRLGRASSGHEADAKILRTVFEAWT